MGMESYIWDYPKFSDLFLSHQAPLILWQNQNTDFDRLQTNLFHVATLKPQHFNQCQ